MKPLVLYHAGCFDGFCAAWVAHTAFKGDCECIPVQYGEPPPEVAGRDVYIVDFSYKRPIMAKIIRTAKSVVVLDHHKTAQAELADLGSDTIVFDMNRSGGRLTWDWFFPGQRSPWLIDYTEDRDLWRHKLPNTQELNAWLRSWPMDFAKWTEYVTVSLDLYDIWVAEGAAILRNERQIVAMHVKNAREIELDGHKTLAVNATVLISEIAGELAADRPFGACYFDTDKGRVWSLRSRPDGVDVSEIAKNHGGGGHKHAAGFEVRNAQ